MYEKANQLADTITEIIQFGMVYVTVPAVVLPKAIICFYTYFTTDLGNDAFEMSFPLLW